MALRVCDQPVLKLLRAMLRAGVMEDGQVRRDMAGTAQGGVISPVMCNVYLRLRMVQTDSVQASLAIRAGACLGSRFTRRGRRSSPVAERTGWPEWDWSPWPVPGGPRRFS